MSQLLPSRTPWPAEFPDVVIHTTVPVRDADPGYTVAKSGNADAALQLARRLMSENSVQQIEVLAASREALILPVVADELAGYNAIPDAMAQILATRLGLQAVAGGIVQTNKVGHTRAKTFQRIVTPAAFSGPVLEEGHYILVDDHVGLGGTLANLKGYLEARGGTVIAMTTLTESRNGRQIALRAGTLTMLNTRHGQALDTFWRSQFHHGIDALTEIEAQNLCRQESVGAIQDILAQAAIEARGEVSFRNQLEGGGTDEFALQHGGAPSGRASADATPSVWLGLDPNIVEELDWQAAVQRVLHDMSSDFIWAPHLRFIYSHVGNELIQETKSKLAKNIFYTRAVLSIEVPKSYRVKVAGASKRLGPSFTRPGSIPLPTDRLLYQVLADNLCLRIERATDRSRSFSHRLAAPDAETMFVSNRQCWSELQAALKLYAHDDRIKYILRLDIANYFESINLKTLLSALDDVGLDAGLSDVLGHLLLSFSGGDGSRGIIQGVYPSDMLGMFYMKPIDQLFDDLDVKSARYVDDLYIFVGSVDEADAVLRRLIPFLRSYDLNLNEVKSFVFPKRALLSVEPDLEELFQDAVDEVSEQLDEETSATEYGFQRPWENEEDGDSDEQDLNIELQATKALFASISEFPGSEEAIERFCLPLFAKAGSNFALIHVLESLGRRPSMTQIYANYLAKFIKHEPRVETKLLEAIEDINFYDWQKMWLLACLMQAGRASPRCLKVAAGLLGDPVRHDALRAVAALLLGRFGDVSRRRALADAYQSVSEYVQLAIYFASRRWPLEERASATQAWSEHGPLHRLMARGLASL